jgi:hypothetical protein
MVDRGGGRQFYVHAWPLIYKVRSKKEMNKYKSPEKTLALVAESCQRAIFIQ